MTVTYSMNSIEVTKEELRTLLLDSDVVQKIQRAVNKRVRNLRAS